MHRPSPAIRIPLLGLATLRSLMHVVSTSPRFVKADVVVIMQEGGFGHTIVGPDIVRRSYPGKRAVFVYAEEQYGWRHNPLVTRLWQDVEVVALPMTATRLGEAGVSHSDKLNRLILKIALRAAQLFAPRRAHVMTLRDLQTNLQSRLEGFEALRDIAPYYRWPMAYFQLLHERPAPPLRLPSELRATVERALARDGHASRPLCTVYIRRKAAESPDPASANRAGSPLADYLPVLELIARRGYRVLVVGEVELEEAWVKSQGGVVLDARAADLPSDLFALYAATEAAVFIGESGGGSWLPMIQGIPALLLNGFPYAFGLPGCTVHYKIIREPSGRAIPYDVLARDHGYEYAFPGMRVGSNTSEEMCDAVSDFLDGVERGTKHAPTPGAPPTTWLYHARGTISPAFFRAVSRSTTPAVSTLQVSES